MNCKPQELAIVVYTTYGKQVGKIVRCLQPVRFTFSDLGDTDCWITEPMLTNARTVVPCPDSWLRPIRPGDISVEEVKELFSPKAPEKQGEGETV